MKLLSFLLSTDYSGGLTPPVHTTSDSGNSSNEGLIIAIIVISGILAFVVISFIFYAKNKNRETRNYDEFSSSQYNDNHNNKADTNDELRELYADREIAKAELQRLKLEENQNQTPVQIAPKSGHRYLVFLIVVVLIGAFIFGVFKIVDFSKNPNNNDGVGKLLSRSARYSDVTITQSDEFTLTNKYRLVPHVDIDDLEITINFLDSSQKTIKTKTKTIGNVVKNGEYSFSFKMSEFSFSEITKISYWQYEVTGGTVEYFA